MKYLYPPVIAEVIDILPLLCSCLVVDSVKLFLYGIMYICKHAHK